MPYFKDDQYKTWCCQFSCHFFFPLCRTTFAFFVSPSLDPNGLTQTGPDHALIGGIVAVVVFVTLCSIILLGRYLARHKGRTRSVEVQSLLGARHDFTWGCHSLSLCPSAKWLEQKKNTSQPSCKWSPCEF